jgi:hypothetical protein
LRGRGSRIRSGRSPPRRFCCATRQALEREAADVEAAIAEALRAGHRTADMRPDGAPVMTSEIGRHIADAVAEIVDMRHPYHAV